MSASGDKADIPDPLSNVCKWPKANIAQHLSGLFGTSCRWPSPAAGCTP